MHLQLVFAAHRHYDQVHPFFPPPPGSLTKWAPIVLCCPQSRRYVKYSAQWQNYTIDNGHKWVDIFSHSSQTFEATPTKLSRIVIRKAPRKTENISRKCGVICKIIALEHYVTAAVIMIAIAFPLKWTAALLQLRHWAALTHCWWYTWPLKHLLSPSGIC
jgi:hypothetical protein